ncbi:MAG: hypothetical protein Q8P41_02595 [Pseudomonadota bacterium]|nr:hypothetical protein [Pseudomonadota bacterium]
MTLLLASVLAAHAATFTAEDLVLAAARGLPTETAARMADSVGTDAPNAVYLLRRGVRTETLTSWGYAVGDAERAEAERLGALAAPPAGISDTDWFEMAELPTRIERADGRPVSGTVVAVVPSLAVLATRDLSFVVERGEARDVWVDARPLGAVVYEEGEDEGLPVAAPRLAHLRRGRTGVIAGALMAVAGGISFAGGWRGTSEGYLTTQSCCLAAMDTYTVLEQIPSSPNVIMMGVGAIGILGAGLSFHFGAQELRLAGAHPGGWEPEPAER